MRNYNYQHEDSECAGNFQISKVYVRLRAKSVNFFFPRAYTFHRKQDLFLKRFLLLFFGSF